MAIKVKSFSPSTQYTQAAVARYRMTRVLQDRTRATKRAIKEQMDKANEKRKASLRTKEYIYDTLNTIVSALDGVGSLLEIYKTKYGNTFFPIPELNFQDLELSRRGLFNSMIKLDNSGNPKLDSKDKGILFDEGKITFEYLKKTKEDTYDLIQSVSKMVDADKEYEPLVRKIYKTSRELNEKLSKLKDHFGNELATGIEDLETGTFQNVSLIDLYNTSFELQGHAENALSKMTGDKKTLEDFKAFNSYYDANLSEINSFISKVGSKEVNKKDVSTKDIKEDLEFLKGLVDSLGDEFQKLKVMKATLDYESDLRVEGADVVDLSKKTLTLVRETLDGILYKKDEELSGYLSALWTLRADNKEQEANQLLSGMTLDQAVKTAQDGKKVLKRIRGAVGNV